MDLKDLEAIVHREMMEHGLHGWTFGLANTKRRLGVCKYRTKRIEIAEYYARNSPPENVLDTLPHEIAHAIAGPAARHGPVWKAVAVRIGATPQACDTSHDAVTKLGDWQATCAICKSIHHRYKRPKSLSGYLYKCAAGVPMTFQFVGNPALGPIQRRTVRAPAYWEAKCSGCGTVHRRIRRPKAGVWYCKCPRRCELTWQFRPLEGNR